jgi:hypothetical protein
MGVVVSLEELEAKREKDLGIDWSTARLMMPGHRTIKLGKRPVGKDTNTAIIARCPGSSQNKGLDFIKAVYSDRTGQE